MDLLDKYEFGYFLEKKKGICYYIGDIKEWDSFVDYLEQYYNDGSAKLKINKLDIGGLGLDDSHILKLFKYLVKPESEASGLTELYMNNNDIGDYTAEIITLLLAKSKYIKKIDVRETHITYKGAIHLMNGFMTNDSLKEINLDKCFIRQILIRHIYDMLLLPLSERTMPPKGEGYFPPEFDDDPDKPKPKPIEPKTMKQSVYKSYP
jgi:hypothetical protein